MNTVYLALGANVGDSQQNIKKAIKLLSEEMEDIKIAPLYLSRAVGYTNQSDFINTAISGKTNLSPENLLEFIGKVEKQIGRIRRFRWGPREIDIDIIFYGEEIIKAEGLTVPHPSFTDRDFVLIPLLDLDDSLVDPVSMKPLKHLKAELIPSQVSIIRKIN
jgi:2-amino-4-hydroxy-6-hydroxymethyldihydropteridine diphosphokinase